MGDALPRVGAIESATDDEVRFFGYGVLVGDRLYEGDHPIFGQLSIGNPCIELDAGGHVFGAECWWGGEDKVKATIGNRRVVRVPPPHDGPAPPVTEGVEHHG